MKKIKKAVISVLVLFAAGAFGMSVNAQGGVIGNIYSTDILAYVNGLPVPSYNIGGKTAVIIENISDMGCGFGYDYDDSTRTLKSEVNWHDDAILPEKTAEIKRGTVGEMVGNVYATDIKVIVNGHEITGYNIGGKTAVVIEDLGAFDGISPNEQYGFSKYLCSFVWNANDRTVRLESVHGFFLHNVNVPCIKLLSNDNVLKASFDPMNDYQMYIYDQDEGTYVYTDSFKNEKYILKPLYLKINDDMTEIGLCFVDGRENTEMFLKNLDDVRELLWPLIDNSMPYEDVMKKFDDGVNYKILDSIETEDYMLIVVEDLKSTEYGNVYYINAAKSGGYCKVSNSSTSYTTRMLEKTGENEVKITVAPFAGPPSTGLTSMSIEIELDRYITVR